MNCCPDLHSSGIGSLELEIAIAAQEWAEYWSLVGEQLHGVSLILYIHCYNFLLCLMKLFLLSTYEFLPSLPILFLILVGAGGGR